jgi:glycosyltransferase involved in cell wall biosynthesis
MNPLVSVAIGTYEMNGKGVECLNYGIESILRQAYPNIEIVISDSSRDDCVEAFVSNRRFPSLRYLRMRGGTASDNFNNAINNCGGEIIKVLCQDDYLLGENALEIIVSEFEKFPDCAWLVAAYWHTHDRIQLRDLHTPRWSEKPLLWNPIGTHSCLSIRSRVAARFDATFLWYMDIDLYYRLYQTYGKPIYSLQPTMVQYRWPGQASRTICTPTFTELERIALLKKYGDGV